MLTASDSNIASHMKKSNFLDVYLDYSNQNEEPELKLIMWNCANFAVADIECAEHLTNHRIYSLVLENMKDTSSIALVKESIWAIFNSLHNRGPEEILKIIQDHPSIIVRLLQCVSRIKD